MKDTDHYPSKTVHMTLSVFPEFGGAPWILELEHPYEVA